MNQSTLDDYYRLHFRGNRLYGELAKLLGESSQTLFLARLLLNEEEGICQSEICESLSVPKQTMSRILKEMINEGKVTESPSPKDGREKIFSLPSNGRQHAQTVIEQLNSIENACLDGSAEELAAVNGFNGRYLDRLQEIIEKEKERK